MLAKGVRTNSIVICSYYKVSHKVSSGDEFLLSLACFAVSPRQQ